MTKAITKYQQRLQRFIDRIGKRIYRNDSGCQCRDCISIVEQGLIVHDESHAMYLCDVEGDYARDNVFLRYRDIK